MSKAALERQNVQDFASILSQSAGARFIAGVIDFCGVFRDETDAGTRTVGLMLYRMCLGVEGGERAYINGRDELIKIGNREE